MVKEPKIVTVVREAVDVRELRRNASSIHTRFSNQLGELEEDITRMLHRRFKVPDASNYYARLEREERGGRGVPYKTVIDQFCAEHPEHAAYFAQWIEAWRTKPVETLAYGYREEELRQAS